MRKHRSPKKSNRHIFLKGLETAFLFIVMAALTFLRPKLWDSRNIFVMVTNEKSGDILVSALDPGEGTRAEIVIPGTTQVQVAGELGSWKLRSVWQLGVNEKIGGDLLSRTIVKNFFFPVLAWRDEASGKTNMNWGDKLRVGLFNLKIGKKATDTINLRETSFLRKTRFVDGEEGFVVSGEVPSEVAAIFSGINRPKSAKARLVDYSQSAGLAERVGNLIEIMGIKIASVQRLERRDFDCALTGTNRELVRKLNLILNCHAQPGESVNNFDISLEFGRGFLLRF